MNVLRHVTLSIENGRVAFLYLSSSHQRHLSPQAMTITIVRSMMVKPIADSHENFRCRNEIKNPITPKTKPTSESRAHWRGGRTVLPGEKSMRSLHGGNEYPKRPRRVTIAMTMAKAGSVPNISDATDSRRRRLRRAAGAVVWLRSLVWRTICSTNVR